MKVARRPQTPEEKEFKANCKKFDQHIKKCKEHLDKFYELLDKFKADVLEEKESIIFHENEER